METIGEKLVKLTEQAINGYVPPDPSVPSCASFVSDMLMKIGFGQYWTAWVPDFFNLPGITETEKPREGDLVIFKDTYNAPGGTDKTHVAIYHEENGKPGFYHYSNSAGKAVYQPFTDYWQGHLECYLRLPEIKSNDVNEARLKLFYHDKVKFPVLVDAATGDREEIVELIATARTATGKTIALISQRFQSNPMLSVTSKGEIKDFRVLSIGFDGLKYEGISE